MNIERTLAEYGPWYLLMRVHGRVWNDKNWPLTIRYEACRLLSQKINKVLSDDEGKHRPPFERETP